MKNNDTTITDIRHIIMPVFHKDSKIAIIGEAMTNLNTMTSYSTKDCKKA
jgi:hypothetical protein